MSYSWDNWKKYPNFKYRTTTRLLVHRGADDEFIIKKLTNSQHRLTRRQAWYEVKRARLARKFEKYPMFTLAVTIGFIWLVLMVAVFLTAS